MPRRRAPKKIDWQKIKVIGLAFFLAALALGGMWRYRQDKMAAPEAEVPPAALETASALAEPQCAYRSLLNGVCVASAGEVSPRLVGVMVENHPESRPPSGLARAAVVYEAPVEANYTRFLAFYPIDEQVDKVGPIRSLRPYYIDWVEEYGRPMLFHVGGSPEALAKAEARRILNLNEFYRGWYYWRSRDRGAPHNVYTSSDLWKKALNDYGAIAEALATSTWQFAITSEPCILGEVTDNEVSGGQKKIAGDNVSSQKIASCAYSLTVSFLPPAYEATWQYATTTGRYFRYQDSAAHTDSDGTPIEADTVIVQRVRTRVLDEAGRLAVATVGSGQALIFREGRVFAGRWQKQSARARTEWLDETGAPLQLSPGKIWVEAVPPDGRVIYGKSNF